MKKFKTIIALLFAVSNMCAYSQSLSNSTWEVFDTSGNFYTYFHFNNDTLFYSNDSVNFYYISIYQENGNNLLITDIPGYVCSTDTGSYTFAFHNDSVKFNRIYDICPYRSVVFYRFYWVRHSSAGIQNINSSSSITIFPNPAVDEVFIKSDCWKKDQVYYVSDIQGKEILKGKLAGETTKIDISNLNKGYYLIQVREKNRQLFKLVKE